MCTNARLQTDWTFGGRQQSILQAVPSQCPPPTAQMELRTMREGLAKLVDPPIEEPLDAEEAWRQAMGGAGGGVTAGGAGGAQAGAGGVGGGSPGAEPPELDDDELLALQAEDQWVGATALRGPCCDWRSCCAPR